MSNFISTKKGNPCQICGDTSGKCREHNDGEILLCMTFADSRFGEIQNGFKCIKTDTGKGWSTWKIDNSQEWTEQQRQEWQQRQQERRIEQATWDKARAKRSLSEQERHEQYTELLNELTLHPDDRANLIERGFTNKQIELSGFKSVDNWQKLRGKYSSLLPGMGIGGKRLLTNEGYLCPIRNHNGLITSLQIRLRKINSGEGRYRWLSSVTKKNPDGQSPHIYTKSFAPELPLAVHKPQGKPQGVALAEGTGAKPFLTSQRLNLTVIGAAGGQHASSPQQLKSVLSLYPEVKEVPIFADAGSVTNRIVVSQYQRTFDLLKSLGIIPTVAWWGQVNKNDPDIDELPPERYSEIKYISVEEFENICREYGGIEPFTSQEKAKVNWRKNRRFTPDTIINSEYFKGLSTYAKRGTISFILSGMGTGKSTELKKFVETQRLTQEHEDTGFVVLGYRNTLLLQLCEKLVFYHIHDKDSAIMQHDPNGGIALCVNSLWKLPPEYFDNKIIILDEVISVVKHLLQSKTIRNPRKIVDLFAEAIRRSRQVICLDGMLVDWCVKYLHELAPEKKIIRIENTYKGGKANINWLNGTINSEKIKKNDRSPWLKMLMESTQKFAVCSDSQVMIETLYEILTGQGLKVLRIDSKTVAENYVKEALTNLDAYIEKHKIDVLLYTPSAESGVDVSIKGYFSQHFGFFWGVLDADSIIQMIGRIRDPHCKKYIWVKSFVARDEKTGLASYWDKEIHKAIQQLTLDEINENLIGSEEQRREQVESIVKNSLDSHYRTNILIESLRNYEMLNLRECVKEVLLKQGYRLNECTLERNDDHDRRLKEETLETKKRNCHDIFTAKMIDPELVPELAFDANWEKQCEAINANMRKRLPGIENTPSWCEDFIFTTRYKDREYLGKLELYWLFKHPEIARHQSQERFCWMAQKSKTFIRITKTKGNIINALYQVGFDKILDHLEAGGTYDKESPELKELMKKSKKPEIANALGHPGKQNPVRYLGRLLKKMGLELDKTQLHSGKRTYRLKPINGLDPYREDGLACIETKWNKEPQKLDWEAAINEAHGIVPKEVELQAEESTPNLVENLGVNEPQVTPIEELAEALKYCESREDFQGTTEGCLSELIDDAITFYSLDPNQNEGWTPPTRYQLREWQKMIEVQVEPVSDTPLDQVESVKDSVPQPQEYHWKKLPIIGNIVQWFGNWGSEKLTIKAIEPDGRCQLEGFGGMHWNSHIRRVMPVSG